MKDIREIDKGAFFARAAELLEGTDISRMGGVRVWNYADLGSYFISAEERAARPDRWILDLSVKTSRAPSFMYECDGTTPPTRSTDALMVELATEFGVSFRGYEPCEKGWGSYSFEVS